MAQRNQNKYTALMVLAHNNPQLLDQDWAMELIQALGGKRNCNGATALTLIFDGQYARNANFMGGGFRALWEAENAIKTNLQRSCLDYIKAAPAEI